MYVLAKQRHFFRLKNKRVTFADYAIFMDLLYPGTSPGDRYFSTLKSARNAFKEMVENV